METLQIKKNSKDVWIGNIPVPEGLALAPMAGATSVPFRVLCRSFGASLTVTEMVSAKGLILGNDKTLHYLERHPSEYPVAAQLFGMDPAAMAEATQKVAEKGFHLVDINMGCPVDKITGSGGGCALMKQPRQAAAIVSAMVHKSNIPVTAKIRAGWDESHKNAPEMAKALEDAGAAAITIHARTREQKYAGNADWDCIAAVKAAVKIPVFGNGDVDSVEKAEALLKNTACDGIAIGRGALKTPWIFRDIRSYRQTGRLPTPPNAQEIGDMLLGFARNLMGLHGEHTAMLMMRRLGAGFSKGLQKGGEYRQRLVQITQYQDLAALTLEYFVDEVTR